MIDLQIVIPSRRCPALAAKALALAPRALLCIAESEVAEYQVICGNDVHILAHPDTLLGMGRKRQWILDHVDAEAVFMIDDDVSKVYAIVGQRQRHIRNPGDILQIIRNAAGIAKEIGTACFGFNHTADTRHVSSLKPFALGGYVNGFAFGVVGRSIRFDEALDTKQDIDFSLQCLQHHRILWKDSRFAFVTREWFTRPGGMAGVRTQESLSRDIARLKARWGSAVEVEHFTRSGLGKHQNVRIQVKR